MYPMKYDVIAVGDYCLDLIFSGMSQLPVLGTEVLSSGLTMIPGGAYNTVTALHRLGVRVGWAGDFGNDEFSSIVLRNVREEHLDESLFIHHAKPYRNITVAVSTGEDRAFITYYDQMPVLPAGFKALKKASAKILYIPGLYFGKTFDIAQPFVRAKHMKLVMDGNTPSNETFENPSVLRALKSIDLFLPNSREVRQYTGIEDLERAIQKLGEICRLVVVKDGANGAFAYLDHRLFHQAAIPIKAVETTGAGDCFNAGFLKAWLNELPIEDCLAWGNAVGGLSTLRPGGTGKFIDSELVITTLNKLRKGIV